jgi:hypothetical protein
MPRIQSHRPLLAAAVVVLVAGCGGRHGAPAAPATYLDRAGLTRGLSHGFRDGLDRLAVMSQPPDDGSDLSQSLPTGLLDRVSCAPEGARPAARAPWRWRCTVRWETAAGQARRTSYAVRVSPTGCYSAGADPALPPHRDPTIQTYSEHPLNTLVGVGPGC